MPSTQHRYAADSSSAMLCRVGADVAISQAKSLLTLLELARGTHSEGSEHVARLARLTTAAMQRAEQHLTGGR